MLQWKAYLQEKTDAAIKSQAMTFMLEQEAISWNGLKSQRYNVQILDAPGKLWYLK